MIRIITDSSTLYTVEEGKKMNIDVVPLSVTINGQSYREYEEISAIEFNEIISKGHIPTSSQPPIGDYIELFNKYPEDDILVITMADGLSGTYQSCLSAKKMVVRDNIAIVNSRTLSLAQRLLVNDAIEMRDAGYTFEEIVTMINEKGQTSQSFLFPQDFDYLKRGGRLTPLAATLSGFLRIQPIITQSRDKLRLEKFGIGRSFKQAVKKVLDSLEHQGIDQSYRFCISHAFVTENAQEVAKEIREKYNKVVVEIEDLSCAMIVQGGPQCLAIQMIAK